MPESAWSVIAANGPWAVLFVGLLYYVMREGSKREGKLMEFIEKLAPRMQAVEDKIDANTAVVTRMEATVASCEPRHENAKARVA